MHLNVMAGLKMRAAALLKFVYQEDLSGVPLR
jgi:hypothetical protein